MSWDRFDEPHDKVAQFANQEKLTHPILLMGRQVAREKYAVGALPTAFWVNQDGKVVDYVVDFNPGDEVHLTKSLLKLLSERP